MKFAPVIILLVSLYAPAQSGRVKPAETPTPRPTVRPSIVGVPVSDRPRVIGAAVPAPTPTPKTDDNIEVVDSILVPIPVSVLDANGRPLTNLGLGDFELRINGEAAEISDIARSETPVRLAVLFDNSSSVQTARDFEIDAAVKFLRQVMRPDRDLAALYSVSTVTRLEHQFTSDATALINAIRGLPPPAGATALLDGIEMAAKYLSEVDGRRVIVIISDGDDTKTDTTFEKALRTAQIWNCQIYVVQTLDFENFIRTGSRKGNANIRQLTAERRMIELARQTGGAVYSPIDQRELDDAFRQISAELAQQYILSYYPERGTETRGEFRQIEVTVPSRNGVTVRARRGFYIAGR
jgi:Ca-activated chloride channel family protein